MSNVPFSTSRFEHIFNSALDAYRTRTSQDLASHPLLAKLQSSNSANAILAILREQIPAFGQPQSSHESHSKWLVPVVDVLYTLSATLGEGIGLVFSPAKLLFAGIGVLFLVAKDVSASQEKLVDLFNRIGHFFRRLEIYTEVPPTSAMMDIIVKIMVEVLAILGMATKEMKRGRTKRYLKKLMGNTDIEDSVQRLDALTQEEARIASAELMKITHAVDGKVIGVDDRVKRVDKRVQDVGDRVEEIDGRVHGMRIDVKEIGESVQGVDDKVQVIDDWVQNVGDEVHAVKDKVQVVKDEVQNIGDSVQGVGDKVQRLDHKLDHVSGNQLRDDLLRWLSPPDPSINHNIACKIHQQGTAQWFFQGSIFNQWKSTDSLLWLNGKPGSGKSILCSSIIQDIMTLHDAGRASLAYFYFDFRDVDKQKIQNLLPSLLIQLSARSDSCCDILSRLYSTHDRGVRKPSDRAMIDCLREMLTFETQGPVYIVMDALDECPTTSTVPSPREEVLDLVEELVGLHLSKVHICVTSRPELDIQDVLEPLTLHPVSLHDESGQKQDIADYVSSFVHSDRRMRRWRGEDKDLVIKTLSEKADGMFRWVFCQLEILRHCFPPSVRRILDELPDSLDETYERILREIRKPKRGHAHRLLQCLVAAVRPLKVEELAEVLSFDFDAEGILKLNPDWRWKDQEEAVMSACSSLVIVVKDGDSRIVQFSHFSVKEYLTSNRLLESSNDVSRFHILLEPAHTILAQACLGVLLRLGEGIYREKIKDFPLAVYAAQYWIKHAQFENVSSHIKGGMECLFDGDKPFYSAWLWLQGVEDRNRVPIATMRPLKSHTVPLYCASYFGFYDLVQHLIAERPKDVNAIGGWFSTPLHAAVAKGHVEVVSLLLKHLPVGIRSKFMGQTPLHSAALTRQLGTGTLLLENGADVNALQENGISALHLAVMFQYPEFVRLLLDHGANVHIRNTYGLTPYQEAKLRKSRLILQLLLERGAKLE